MDYHSYLSKIKKILANGLEIHIHIHKYNIILKIFLIKAKEIKEYLSLMVLSIEFSNIT